MSPSRKMRLATDATESRKTALFTLSDEMRFVIPSAHDAWPEVDASGTKPAWHGTFITRERNGPYENRCVFRRRRTNPRAG